MAALARFESIVSNLRSCGPLAYSDNERAKQLLYTLDDHVLVHENYRFRGVY
jgi:hypothetical protein